MTGVATVAPTPAAGDGHPAAPVRGPIWFNGRLVPWEAATVHVMTHALHYGSSVFEGIRCYDTPRGPALFRATAHLRRLRDSARVYRMPLPVDAPALLDACKAVVRESGLRAAYLRPLVWRGAGGLGLNPRTLPVEVMVAAIAWGSYLGDEMLETGVDVGVSSWARVAPNTIPAMAKAGGNYLSGQLVALEAERHGYHEGIALDSSGLVSEGAGENLFLVRGGEILTPPASSALLPGITRDTIITLATELGYRVGEAPLPREALYLADELFLTGTAAEVMPVRSVDRLPIGDGRRGPVTAQLQAAYFALVHGERADHRGWLELV